MAEVNLVRQMKEIIAKIKEADEAYFVNDNPIMTDLEYDNLVRELKSIEQDTGVVFSDSPSKKVSGGVKAELKSVPHTKPMLSAKKTKDIYDIERFIGDKEAIISWKLDGLTLVLRYENGEFKRALTRGKDGLIGEDVTHTVKHFRNIPERVPCTENFEVRGEGIISWADFDIIKKSESVTHPRNVAAGAVRTAIPDEGKLSHLDFIAFELIMPNDTRKTKLEQLDFLLENDFDVVDFKIYEPLEEPVDRVINTFNPDGYLYPVDGIIVEYNDMAYGKSLGATAHHENRLIALKWEDEQYETIFRGVEINTSRTGIVEINAVFDPVEIAGATIKRANVHGLSGFEKFQFGIGDIIKVYKANMIVPQVAENLTKSGTFKLPEYCSCCGTKLEVKISNNGSRNLYCSNEDCMARNAQKIARFCDRKAMNIEGLPASVIGALMEKGFVKSIKDIYHLSEKRKALQSTKGLGVSDWDGLFERIENSRKCRLHKFLLGLGIPLLGPESAKHIDEYFEGSFKRFEEALTKDFNFTRIDGISQALHNKIYAWYDDENMREIWVPLLDEVKFRGDTARIRTAPGNINAENPLEARSISVVGVTDENLLEKIKEQLYSLGFTVNDETSPGTDFLLVALKNG